MRALQFPTWSHALALLGGLSVATIHAAPESEIEAQSTFDHLPTDQRLALSARWDLGYYLFQMQEFAAAAGEFEKLRKALPDEPTLLALIGSCYTMSGRWEEGEKALLEAVKVSPDDADVNGLIGQFYMTSGKAGRAAVYLERALKFAPELLELRTRLVDSYLERGQPARAKEHLDVLFKQGGGEGFTDVALDHAYARCLLLAGKFREGIPHANKAFAADPANTAYARTLGLCLLGANRFSEAARLLTLSKGKVFKDAEHSLQLGEALFQNKSWENAEKAWLAGILRFPDSYDLYSRLVEYYLGIAKPDQAARVVSHAARTNPTHPGNLLLVARYHRKLGDFALARKSLERLKRQTRGNLAEEALWEEAQLEYESGRMEACAKILDRLLAGEHKKTEAHLMKAKMAMYKGNWNEAQARVRDAKASNPYNLRVYSVARQAFSRPQDRPTLADMLKDALELMPGEANLSSRVRPAMRP